MKRACFAFLFLGIYLSCSQRKEVTYIYQGPDYSAISLEVGTDTLELMLDSTSFRSIESVHYFKDGVSSYISYFDKHALCVNVYNFATKSIVKKVDLKKILNTRKIKRTSAYLLNWDTIVIINNLTQVYLSDSSETIYDSVKLQSKPFLSLSDITNSTPPIFKEGNLYLTSLPYISRNNSSGLSQWRVLYKIDFDKREAHLIGNLPPTYYSNSFTIQFFQSSYCPYNEGLILSFPADTNIYKLTNHNLTIGFNGKSQWQKSEIVMEQKDASGPSQKTFLLSDSYSSMIVDSYNNRYIRIYQPKLSISDYRNRIWKKKSSAIVFDSSFRIIGESWLPTELDTQCFFFDETGKLYVRYKSELTDAIRFVPLIFVNNQIRKDEHHL